MSRAADSLKHTANLQEIEMDIEVTMPDLSTTGGEIAVLKWLVEVGQPIRRGQPLMEVETDKATMEVESVESGTMKSQIAQPDSEIAVGEVIAILEVKDSIKKAAGLKPDEDLMKSLLHSASNEATSQTRSPVPKVLPPETKPEARGMFARNRQAVEPLSLSLTLSNSQRIVGRRMQQSKQSIPHFYLQTSVNAEAMISQRDTAGEKKIAWDAFFVCALGKALKDYPRMGCRIHEETLVPEPSGAVGVAVDIDGDLFVVRIVDAAEKQPLAVTKELWDAVQKLKQGDAGSKKLQPAGITITNLGMTQVETFLPIISPPEAGILGVGKVMPQVTASDGEIGIEHRVGLTLAVDHRVVNGKYAADFLGRLVEYLETV